MVPFFFLQLVHPLLATKYFYIHFYAINEGVPPSRDSESQQQPTVDDANANPRYPSADVLASVIERAQQLLGGSAASALSVCYFVAVVMVVIFCTICPRLSEIDILFHLKCLPPWLCSAKMSISVLVVNTFSTMFTSLWVVFCAIL